MIANSKATTIINLWLQALEDEELSQNHWLAEQQGEQIPYVQCDLTGNNKVALDLFDLKVNQAQLLVNPDGHQFFLNHLVDVKESEKRKKNRWNLESSGIYLGFPIFNFIDNSKKRKIGSLFNLRLAEITFGESPAITVTVQRADELQLLPELTISKIIWENFLQFPEIDYEGNWLSRKDFDNWLTGIFQQLKILTPTGVEQSTAASLLSLYKLVAAKPANLERAHSFEVSDDFIIYYKREMQSTRHLQSDLAKIGKEKFLLNLPPENPGYQFFFGSSEEPTTNDAGSAYNSQPLLDYNHLSASQRSVLKAMVGKALTVVVGPPGTGKTTLLRLLALEEFCRRCLEWAKLDDNLLPDRVSVVIASVNNLSVDQALADTFLNDDYFPLAIRMGSRDNLIQQTLPFLQRLAERLSEPVLDYDRSWQQSKEALLKVSVADSDQLLLEARRFHHYWVLKNRKPALSLIQRLIKEIEQQLPLRSLYSEENRRLFWGLFPVIGTTLLSIKPVVDFKLNCVKLCLIDEAAQTLPYQVVPLLMRSSKALLLGDPYQATPVVNISSHDWHELASNKQLDETFIKEHANYFPDSKNLLSSHSLALSSAIKPIYLLEHFRCQPDLIAFCNKICGYDLQVLTPPLTNTDSPLAASTFWYYNSDNAEKRSGKSWCNMGEALEVTQVLCWLWGNSYSKTPLTVLTPYYPQSQLIKKLWRQEGAKFGAAARDVTISTIHAFQGQESSIVVFSATLTTRKHGFLNFRPNLLNVAVSRACDYFIYIGALDNLASGRYTGLLKDFLLQKGKDLTSEVASWNLQHRLS